MCTLLGGTELPDRLEVIDAIAEGCGGTDEDRQRFATAWRKLAMPGTIRRAWPRATRRARHRKLPAGKARAGVGHGVFSAPRRLSYVTAPTGALSDLTVSCSTS
jgi:hypothetical protein